MDSQIQEIFVTIGAGLLLAFGAVILGALTSVAVAKQKQLRIKYAAVDNALVPFGQTATGQFLHGQVTGLRSRFDDATDPAVLQLAAGVERLKLLYKILPDTPELISPEMISDAAKWVIDAGGRLLDGKPEPAPTGAIAAFQSVKGIPQDRPPIVG